MCSSVKIGPGCDRMAMPEPSARNPYPYKRIGTLSTCRVIFRKVSSDSLETVLLMVRIDVHDAEYSGRKGRGVIDAAKAL